VTGKDRKVVSPSTVDYIYVRLVLDKPVLDKRPPDRIESALRHGLELFYSSVVLLVKILDYTEQPIIMTVIRRNLVIIVFHGDEIVAWVRYPGRRGAYRSDPDAMFREIGLKILPISVIVVFEEQDRLHTIAPEQQRLVCGNCG